MSESAPIQPPVLNPASTPERTLRRLFLTLFLRGRGARGLQKSGAPKSVATKLTWALVIYALVGLVALTFLRQPVFVLSVYLHAMTFVFLGMFVAASSGEMLFNKDEADILMHRPITSRQLLWAKIAVLVRVSLWLAGAFNLAGLFVGVAVPDGNWLYPLVHLLSSSLQALFCVGAVVVIYQLCLRWFGRERLDGLMTTAQVLIAVGAVLGGQIVPQIILRTGSKVGLTTDSWWISLLPPAWFAGLDDAVAGSGRYGSWILAGFALIATMVVLWLAFGKLAHDYGAGLQMLNESTATRPGRRASRRWFDLLVKMPPLSWWLRDSVSRASFLLVAAYLVRDRDVKLRIYPGIAPFLAMPVIFLVQDFARHGGGGGGFGVAFSGSYLGLIPMLGLNLLQYSQQWQAADLFRAAPMSGPAPLCHGARRAVLCILTLPVLVVFGLVAWFGKSDGSSLLLLVPGIIAMPVYALVPNLRGACVPLSLPTEEAKSAGRGMSMILVMLPALALASLATTALTGGWFWWLLLGESVLVIVLYIGMRAIIAKARWSPMD